MEITSQMVKELRDKTNAGMMDCKKAFGETDYFESDILKKYDMEGETVDDGGWSSELSVGLAICDLFDAVDAPSDDDVMLARDIFKVMESTHKNSDSFKSLF